MLNDGVGVDRAMGSELLPWPKRLTAPPRRLEELGISSDEFLHDNVSLGIPSIYFNQTSIFCQFLAY